MPPSNTQPSDTLVVQGEPYHFVKNFAYGMNKPQLYKSNRIDDYVVRKTFCNPVFFITSCYAYQTWRRVRDTLVSAGFPDILEVTSMYQLNRYIPGVTLGDTADNLTDLSALIRTLHATIHSVSHHIDTLAEVKLAHGDIKPDNIVLRAPSPTGSPDDTMLIDFDFLHPFARRDTYTLGTYAYMAPEVARSSRYTPTSDIFSLGFAPVYTLLNDSIVPDAHRHPWGDHFVSSEREIFRRRQEGMPRDMLEQFAAHMRDALRRAAPDREKESRQLVNFVQNALQTDPEARPQNGTEIRQILTDTGNVTEL